MLLWQVRGLSITISSAVISPQVANSWDSDNSNGPINGRRRVDRGGRSDFRPLNEDNEVSTGSRNLLLITADVNSADYSYYTNHILN